ncbi:MAG: LrgB family protein [Tissierellia bacterium]|nr:LrgB family protein [Tissierellia bacterium]
MISPYLGIIFTIIGYLLGLWLFKRFRLPILNPMFVGIITCIILMKITGITYEEYRTGASYITFFIAPATVSLMVPLYRNLDILKRNFIPILTGILVGSITAIVSVIVLSNLFQIGNELKISLSAQSITTAIALPLTELMGGVGAITSIAISTRGILGAVLGPVILDLFKIKNPVAKGVAMGTTSHATGTAKAIEMGEVEGAISGLSIAIAGIITAIILPIIIKIVI